MPGVTIKVFLADGTPLGLRIIEKSNWTGRGFTMSSPSMAAAVMLGRSSNGRTDWKDGQGQSLKKIQEAAGAG